MLAQAEIPPELAEGLRTRREEFVRPFTATPVEPEQQRRRTVEDMTGLLAKLEHKTSKDIADLHDQELQALQKFLGQVPWGHQPRLRTLARQVVADLGALDGVIEFDPSAFAKKGTKSLGVARQWCGRLGKVENCQVVVSMGEGRPGGVARPGMGKTGLSTISECVNQSPKSPSARQLVRP